jgi:hypothetical protein
MQEQAVDAVVGEKSADETAKQEQVALLIGELTAQEAAKLAAKFSFGIFKVTQAGRAAYFKHPNMDQLNRILAMPVDKNRPTDRMSNICNILFVGGCDELYTSPLFLVPTYRAVADATFGEEADVTNFLPTPAGQTAAIA